jgi:thiamine biosynthesis lipoprotein
MTLICFTLGLTLGSPPARASDPEQMRGPRVVRLLGLMGTQARIEVEAVGRSQALVAAEAALQAMEAVERRMSSWRTDSELSRLNHAPVGLPHRLSPELEADLLLARRLWWATDGGFDPCIGSLVEAWGMRGEARVPTPARLQRALESTGINRLEMAPGRATRTHPDLWLDAGGFGKGVALDGGLRSLQSRDVYRALLDLGGQIAVLARQGPGFRLAVAHPHERSRLLLELQLANGSLATSGNGERSQTIDGSCYGHILDPRSGRPAHDFGSLTIMATRAGRADGLATGLYVLGADRALERVLALPGVEALTVEPGPSWVRVRATPGLRGRLRRLDPGVSLTYVTQGVPAPNPHPSAKPAARTTH